MATSTNAFVGNIYKGDTFTENGAVSNSTTGSSLIDQFGKSGAHRGRDISTVFAEQSMIWGENPEMSIRFIFYLRLITRKSKGFKTTDKVQSGQGARDEAFKRLLWIAKYHPNTFYKNLWLVPVVGSWKDLFTLVELDKTLKLDAIDVTKVYELMQKGIFDNYNLALVQKYLPQIKANSKCHSIRSKILNEFAKGFAKYCGWSMEQYRKFKRDGVAHRFQRIIAAKLYNEINWNEIPGKALFNLVSGNFLKTHGLEENYLAWLGKQPVAKFTGYVYEMLDKIIDEDAAVKNISLAQQMTIDKQFNGLIELAKKNEGGIKGNVWVAVDTSGSMAQEVANTTAFNICVSLGIYFSELNVGAFHNHIVMFDEHSKVLELKGNSFVDKARQICNQSTAWGSTNFQSVIDEIVRVRTKNPSIPVEDFPQTLIVVSDMQFNIPSDSKTNYEVAMAKLAAVGLPPMKIIWWDCTGRVSKEFPSTMDDLGTYMVSGFDGSIITLICGGEQVIDEKTGMAREKTMEEKVHDALSQEILTQIEL